MNDLPTVEPGLVEGRVDGFDRGAVHGWAWFPGKAEATVALEVLVDGRRIAEGVANAFRADLSNAGKRGGRCAFSIRLSFEEVDVEGPVWITVRSQDGQPLTGGELSIESTLFRTDLPIALEGETGLAGCVEQFGPDLIVGWIAQPADGSGAPAQIEFWEAGERRFAIQPHIWRADLAEAREGNGRWGFEAQIPPSLRDNRIHVIEVCAGNDRRPITRHPIRVKIPSRQSGP